MASRSILAWINDLPTAPRLRAQFNADPKMLNRMCDSQPQALRRAFNWELSPEKAPYWVHIIREEYDEAEQYLKLKSPNHEVDSKNSGAGI